VIGETLGAFMAGSTIQIVNASLADIQARSRRGYRRRLADLDYPILIAETS